MLGVLVAFRQACTAELTLRLNMQAKWKGAAKVVRSDFRGRGIEKATDVSKQVRR